MRNKAALVLMEQTAMLLVFALAAALCLGIFAKAGRIAEETAREEQGAFLAQTAAELLKAGHSPKEMELPEGYSLNLQRKESVVPGLALGTVTVFWEEEPVFSLDTGWQEVLP